MNLRFFFRPWTFLSGGGVPPVNRVHIEESFKHAHET